MSKGFLILAQNNTSADYIKQAYALALSIKITQPNINSVALCTDDLSLVTEDMKQVFDYIIEIPWGDMAKNSQWKIENRWKHFYLTPYDETVVLDADMIFTDDYTRWWDFWKDEELWFTTNVHTYRNELVSDYYYRKAFTENNLPNLYTAMFYFKKTEYTARYFKLLDCLFANWKEFYTELLPKHKPNYLSCDVAYAIALKVISDQIINSKENEPSFVHMKSKIQNTKDLYDEDWTQHIPTIVNEECTLYVGNYLQKLPFHYTCKNWLTDCIISKLEKGYNEQGIRVNNSTNIIL